MSGPVEWTAPGQQPDEPTVQVVVARHREDVSWLEGLGMPGIVYDKSGGPESHIPSTIGLPVIGLPNIGRETHTYLTHIVRSYPDFPDYTVFLQGSPFVHMGPEAGPDTLKAAIERNIRLGVQFTGFAWYKLKCDRLGRPHDLAKPENQGKWLGWGKDIPVGEVYARLFACGVPETFLVTAPAGMLFVARARILARPLQFYQVALELIEADPQDENNTGHAFERLWGIVFNGNKALNRETTA